MVLILFMLLDYTVTCARVRRRFYERISTPTRPRRRVVSRETSLSDAYPICRPAGITPHRRSPIGFRGEKTMLFTRRRVIASRRKFGSTPKQ